VGQGRVARAEDQVILHFLANLVAQGRPHVDLGEHAEALCLERVPYLGRRLADRASIRMLVP